MNGRMKLLIFIFSLCTVQVLDCKSFDFGTLFASGNYESNSPPSDQKFSSSNTLEGSEQKQENASFSLNEELEEIFNVSASSPAGILSNTSDADNHSESSVDNSTEKVLDNSNAPVNISQTKSSVKSEDILTTETSTVGNHSLNVTLSSSKNLSSSTEDPEEVVLGTQPSTFTVVTKTIYQKTIEWVGDTYTLSILVPIAAGVLFAVTIILTIATCRCIRRKCRRRSFRKRVLPDSIKSLRPSDKARLLGDCDDSSDEF